MSALSEEAFRALLDEHGVLRPDRVAKVALDRSQSYAVFAQRPDALLPIETLKAQAARFFQAKLGVTVDKRYVAPPETDAVRFVLATDDALASGTRLCFGRRADATDHALAEQAERQQNTSGMSLLAQRCATVWHVAIESAGHDDVDRVSLTIAAILASVLLGPILTPAGDELFGVRTARMKLEGRSSPYR